MPVPSVPIGAIFFAVGSLIFSYHSPARTDDPHLDRVARCFASGLRAVTLPLQLAGFPTGPLGGYSQWLPALVFQVALALWLIIKGVSTTVVMRPA